MDANIRQILEFLSDVPVGTKKDISAEMNGIFPLAKYPINSQGVSNFVTALMKYTDINQYTSYRREAPLGFIGLNASLNNDGAIELKKELDRVIQGEVSQSAISVNKSIISTNDAIKDTNKRMLEHAVSQENIMREQSNFVKQQLTYTEKQTKFTEDQVGLVKTQNKLYKFTLILTAVNIAVGLGVLIATLMSSADKELLSIQRSQLASKDKELKQLQLLKADTVHYVLHYPILKNSSLKNKK